MLASLILVCNVTACNKQADSSTVNESVMEQDVSQAEKRTEGFDMERIRKSVMIKGQSFDIPIALSDLGEGWTWKEHEASWAAGKGGGLVYVYYNDEEWFVGSVRNYYEGSEDKGIICNLTIETDDCSIDGLVPLQSTKQDVIEKYGEPNEISEKSGYYHYISMYNNTETAEPSDDKVLVVGFDEDDVIIKIIINYEDAIQN